MFQNNPAPLSHEALPASKILPGLGERFDLTSNADYLQRYHDIQSGGASPTWCYRTSNGDIITSFHDSPLLKHSWASSAEYFFPNGLNGFRDQIVVDLGAGKTTEGYMFARDLGARAYLAVEYCFAPQLKMNLDSLARNERTVPYGIIYDSIEQVLSALPSASVSFICAGIDDTFPSFEYLLASMAQDLPLALHPDGACMIHSLEPNQFVFPGLHSVSTLSKHAVWVHPTKASQ